jgi:hypothetical protein
VILRFLCLGEEGSRGGGESSKSESGEEVEEDIFRQATRRLLRSAGSQDEKLSRIENSLRGDQMGVETSKTSYVEQPKSSWGKGVSFFTSELT